MRYFEKMALQKFYVVYTVAFISIIACGQSSNKRSLPKVTITKFKLAPVPVILERELWAFYSRTERVFSVKRLISMDSAYLLLTYRVDASIPEVSKQTLISKQIVSATELEHVRIQSSSYNWTPFKATPVIFIQLDYAFFKDQMAALDKSHKIGQTIDKELKAQRLGQWIGGDIAQVGVNILYEAYDWEKAKALILGHLDFEGLLKATTIARRVNISADDWLYEVVYPNTFNGVFVSM